MQLQVDELAAGLLEMGMKPGDRLCLMGSNSVEWEITLLASIKAGLITVMSGHVFVHSFSTLNDPHS